MGSTESRKAYERLVREFADQQDTVTEARKHLSATGGGNGVRVRLLWDNAWSGNSTASADGRYLSFPSWETGDVGIRDLVTSESRLATNKGGKNIGAEAESTAISPDGKRVAFSWCQWGRPSQSENGCELRVAGVDGKGEQLLLDGKKFGNLVPKSWSPDGKWVVVVAGKELSLVSPDGAPARKLPLATGRQIRDAAISPDGKWLAFNARNEHDSRLFVLPLDGPASTESEIQSDAYFMGWSPDGRFIVFYRGKDDADQLFLLPFSVGRVTGEPRHFHSVYAHYNMPRGMTSDGSLIFATENFPADVIVAPINAADASIGTPSAPVNVKVVEPAPFFGGSARFSPDGKKILYSIRPRTVLIRSVADGSERTITVQLASAVRIEWAADSRSLLVAGRSAAGKNGIYRVDLTTGEAAFVADTDTGIYTVSPDGGTIYHFVREGRKLMARDLRTGADRLVATPFGQSQPFDIRVSNDGKKLLAYRAQNVWIVDTATGQARQFGGGKGEGFFGVAWSADDRRILAIQNRGEGCCYNARWDLVSYPLEGGAPVVQPLPDGPSNYRGLWLSPDGKQLATMRIDWLRQVWALDNFLPPAASAARQR